MFPLNRSYVVVQSQDIQFDIDLELPYIKSLIINILIFRIRI